MFKGFGGVVAICKRERLFCVLLGGGVAYVCPFVGVTLPMPYFSGAAEIFQPCIRNRELHAWLSHLCLLTKIDISLYSESTGQVAV